MKFMLQVCPEVFDSIHIKRIQWPFHNLQLVALSNQFEIVFGPFSDMWMSIVLLKFQVCLVICIEHFNKRNEKLIEKRHIVVLFLMVWMNTISPSMSPAK